MVGVAPPSYAKAVQLHNDGQTSIQATVVYLNHKDNSEITASSEVAAGATHVFPEKTVDMGSWQAVAPVKSVSASHQGRNQSLTPAVTGVVGTLHVHVKPGVHLEQGASE